MRRTLSHYWRINLAVIFAAAVATAVLTGALLVGDSVRGSLRDLTLDRLGDIDYVLVRPDFFRAPLVDALGQSPGFNGNFEKAAPFILLNGTTVHSSSKARASRVNIIGLDQGFLEMYDSGTELVPSLEKQSGQIFQSIIINQSLQKELGAQVGDQILISVERPSDIARGSLLGDKDTEDVIESIRLTLNKIIPDEGIGRFGIRPHQTLPLNAYVALPVIQKQVEQEGKVNAMAIAQKTDTGLADKSSDLLFALKSNLKFEDLDLKIIDTETHFVVESKSSILSENLVQIIKQTAQEIQAPALTSFTYLANRMEANGNLLPYSTVAGIEFSEVGAFGGLHHPPQKLAALGNNQILLNTWAAKDLKVKIGDTLNMAYFGVGARDELFEKQQRFEIAGVLKMAGLTADRTLTPNFPGMADADNMVDWDPPFEVDLDLIRSKDETYWDNYRGTPKAFVSLQAAQNLWGSRFGSITSVKIAEAPALSLAQTKQMFTGQLLLKANPEEFNYGFQPVKKQGLATASGATDFGGLFIGFSLFLIISAALLVGLLFRLGIENRVREIGMLLATGWRARKVRFRFLQEGVLLAAIGGLLGLGGAVFYAWLMMAGLRTWWVAAVGSPFLFLHVESMSLLTGYFISLAVVLFSIWLGFRKLSKIPPPALLSGVTTLERKKKSNRRTKITAYISLLFAFGLIGLSFGMEPSQASGLFFGVGALLLISGLAIFSLWLNGKHKAITKNTGASTIIKIAGRNSPRNPGRSMLSAALVGCACFVIVAVGANRVDFGTELLQKDSGAGGYSLIAQSDIPINYDLDTEKGQLALGFSDDDLELLEQAEIMPFRFLPGDDASCLNLYQVEKPRILGTPQTQIKRGGFSFQSVLKTETHKSENDWELLNLDLGENVIPVFGDMNSVMWILHSGLGKDIEIKNEFGRTIKLRFAGLLQKSIFQSELLMSEENFLTHFPSQNGYGYFLAQTALDKTTEIATALEKTLSDYGYDSSTTRERLLNFQAVENTYLSTFQTLGGLGLLLGTLGLGMILIRNVLERRGELATLRAFGFKQATLAWIVFSENAFLLALGIFIGTVSAVIAVAPHIITGGSNVPWFSLTLTLLLVFGVGMLASSVAVNKALKIPLLPALRAE